MLNDQIYKQLFVFCFFIDQILLLKCECGCFVISWPITHQITVFYHGRPPLCYITSWLHSAVVTTVVSAGGYINCLLFVVSCVCGHSCWNRVHGGSVIKWLHQNASPYEHQHVLILHTHTDTLQYSTVELIISVTLLVHFMCCMPAWLKVFPVFFFPRWRLHIRLQSLPVRLSRPFPLDLWPHVQIKQSQQPADGSALGITCPWR